MDRPAIANAAMLVVDGRVIEVGTIAQIRKAHRLEIFEDLGDVIILPGLVNAHTHLELSDCHAGDSPGGSFSDWILSIRARMRLGERDIRTVAAHATEHGIEECLRFGVTCVGDITSQIEESRRVLAKSPISCVSYGEVLGLGPQRARAEGSLVRATDDTFASDRLRIGITPHAPYTVDLKMLRACIEAASQRRLPIAMHLAETPDEREFLTSRSGPFRKVWDSIGQWDDSIETFPGGPIEMAEALGLLRAGALLAHVNYCNDAELALLSRGRSSVVWCPRTHRYFGHPPHRWREMLAAGINVAVATDSCASSPDLNILDELRLVRQLAPDLSAQAIFEMATIRAARALGLQNDVGSLAPGCRADYAIFRITSSNPLEDLLHGTAVPCSICIACEAPARLA